MPQTLTYDLVLLLDASAEAEQRAKILSDVEALLAKHGATIAAKHDWGTRKTAYEIRHKTEAEFHLLQFDAETTVPAELERVLRITDGVTRFRVIKLAKGTPPPADLRQPVAPAAPAEEPGEPGEPAAEEPAAPVRL